MVDFDAIGNGLSLREIKARDPKETNRSSTELELFFDLVYVIAVSAAASGLHSNLAHLQVTTGAIEFILAFLVLWNAWSAFTWFASGYDPDDFIYRIAVMVQMFGSLMIAANLNVFFEQGLTWVGVAGFTIMRVALLSQWFRVYHRLKNHNTVAKRHIIGFTVLQLAWISWLFVPQQYQTVLIMILMVLELIMPLWAHAGRYYSWNPAHIAERYGLLTIIVLGEAVVSTNAILQSFLTKTTPNLPAVLILGSSTLALSFALWWVYFNVPFADMLEKRRTRAHLIVFNGGHIALFASLAALGSALKLVADSLDKQFYMNQLTASYVMLILSVILGVYLFSIAMMRQLLCRHSRGSLWVFLASVLIITGSFFAVRAGLNLGVGIWIDALAPMLMTLCFSIDGKRWRSQLA